MQFITSIAPNRLDRQKLCINSWLNHGNVIAVQLEHEIENLNSMFPNIEFKIGQPSKGFSKITPKITELISYANVPSILINSDIQIKDKSLDQWAAETNILKLGICKDFYPQYPTKLYTRKWGIDVFLILPEMREQLIAAEFCVGCPGWDYWLPYHLWFTHNYEIKVIDGQFHHEIHQIGWTEQDQTEYNKFIQANYKLTKSMMPQFIQDITNRHHVKNLIRWK